MQKTAITQVAAEELRNTMRLFATGVAVVTTEHGGEPQGMTVNSLTSVSMEPPLVLVCLLNGARSSGAVVRRGAFIINILGQRQDAIADRFARRGEQHFEGLIIERDRDGLPYIPKALGRLSCTVVVSQLAGDHVIVIGAVRHCAVRPGTPLLFYGGRYHELIDDGRPAAWYW